MIEESLDQLDAFEIAGLGVDLIVTGSAIFDGKDPAGNARFMLDPMKG